MKIATANPANRLIWDKWKRQK